MQARTPNWKDFKTGFKYELWRSNKWVACEVGVNGFSKKETFLKACDEGIVRTFTSEDIEHKESFDNWMEKTVEHILKMQKRPFARYRTSKWKTGGRTFKKMYKESMTPEGAAGLWGLSHSK